MEPIHIELVRIAKNHSNHGYEGEKAAYHIRKGNEYRPLCTHNTYSYEHENWFGLDFPDGWLCTACKGIIERKYGKPLEEIVKG